MTERKPQNQDKYIVRFPQGMRDHLKSAADESGRSINTEIIQRLKSTIAEDGKRTLHISVSEELWVQLAYNARINKTSIEEAALKILENTFQINGENDLSIDSLDNLLEENVRLFEDYQKYRARSSTDFLSYYNKVLQINHFSKSVLAIPEQLLSSEIKQSAEDLLEVSNAELLLLQDRHLEESQSQAHLTARDDAIRTYRESDEE